MMPNFKEKFEQIEKQKRRNLLNSVSRKKYEHLDLNNPTYNGFGPKLLQSKNYLIQQLNNNEGVRFYQFNNDKKSLAISMTSLISKYVENKELENWKERIGEEEANLIKRRAAINGKKHHKLCEDYLNNLSDEDFIKSFDGLDNTYIEQFKKIVPALQDVGQILAIEQPLYSEKYCVAGTADLIAYYKNKFSIIDHKTSRKEKTKKYVHNYFLQKTGYALMLEEMVGLRPKQIVAIITVNDYATLRPQVFIEDPNNFKDEVLDLFKKWKKENNNNV